MQSQLLELLVKRRRQLGWTQRELAAALGSSPSRVSKMESGHSSVSSDLLFRALDVMGVHVLIAQDKDADPLADPSLSAKQRAQLSRSMLTRQRARQIANKCKLDAGDTAHVLTNLEFSPLERLGRALQRGQLGRQRAQ